MNDTQTTKMLQAILNGQSSTNQRIDKLDKKVDALKTDLKTEIKGVEKRLAKRINSIGRSLAYLEDDTPTREEYEKLEKRVDTIEQKVIPQA